MSSSSLPPKLETEHLMTLYAPLDPPQQIDASLQIFNVRPGGWARGAKIDGTIIQPAGDWLRVMPDGSLRLDVRLTVRTNDDALIYVTYNGIISVSEKEFARLGAGEILTADNLYFRTAPTFQTSHANYKWLNHMQAIGRIEEVKLGEGGYVRYAVFAVK